MSLELVKLSLTEQVSSILEKQVIEGKLKAHSKLKSSRSLAKDFKTSRQVIRSALNILAKKKLVNYLYNDGYYVSSNAYLPHQKEVYILGYGIDASQSFFNNILNITSHSNLREGYSFSSRIIGSRQKLSSKILECELQHIESIHGLKAILVNAVNFDDKAILRCSKLVTPFVYIGDFANNIEHSIELNQVKAPYRQFVQKSVEILQDKKIRNIIYFTGSLNYKFNMDIFDEFRVFWGNFDFLELPSNSSFHSKKEQLVAFSEIIRKNMRRIINKENQVVILNNIASELIIDAFKINGITLGNDLKAFSTNQDAQKISCLHYNYSSWYEALYQLIDELAIAPSNTKKVEVKLEINFRDNGTL